MTRRPYKDIMARVLAKHAGVALDDIGHLDHARGVRTKDGSYTVALFGASSSNTGRSASPGT